MVESYHKSQTSRPGAGQPEGVVQMTTEATPVAIPDVGALKAELEATRDGYHKLVDSLSEDDWKHKSVNPAWTCGELAFHLASSTGFVRGMVDSAKGGSRFNPLYLTPRFLLDRLSVMATRMGARGQTAESLKRRYDGDLDRLIAVLDAVEPGAWQSRITVGGDEHTMEGLFRLVPEHLAEHGEDIRKSLGRG